MEINFSFWNKYFCQLLNNFSLSADLLYLGNSLTVELPSFSPYTSCSVKEYPLAGLSYAVSAIVGGEVMVCGGQYGWFMIQTFLYFTEDLHYLQTAILTL